MDTLAELFIYSLYAAGAFLFWIGKGCNTPFIDELTDRYKARNSVTTIIMLGIILFVVIKINN